MGCSTSGASSPQAAPFRNFTDKNRNQAYLLLPASAIEKTIARLLAVTVGLSVYLLIFTTAVSLVVAGVFGLFPGPGYGLFNPLDPVDLAGDYRLPVPAILLFPRRGLVPETSLHQDHAGHHGGRHRPGRVRGF